MEFELPKGSYSVYFRLQLGKASKKFGRRFVDVDQVHGWELKPVRFEVSVSNAQKASSECYLNQFGKWVLYKVGDFSVETPNFVAHIKFSMIQIDCTHTKGGLSVDSVFISPTDFKPTFKWYHSIARDYNIGVFFGGGEEWLQISVLDIVFGWDLLFWMNFV